MFYFAVFLAAYLSTYVVRKLAAKHGWLAQPKKDRWHTKPTALFGGVGFYPVFFIAMLVVVSDRFYESSPLGSKAFYPYAEISLPGGVDVNFLFDARRDKNSCEKLVVTVTDGMLAVCPACQVKLTRCIDMLEPQHRMTLLSTDPLDVPSARLPEGVVTYRALDPAIALLVCQESEKQTSSRAKASRLVCYPPKAARPLLVSPSAGTPNT